MRYFTILSLLSIATGVAPLSAEVGLEKVSRELASEPAYVSSRPLYGLCVIGHDAKRQIWMVLDASKTDSDSYDILYADLNSDGDLTDQGEQFTAPGKYGGHEFQLPDVAGHTEFRLKISARDPATHMVSLRWEGKHKLGGGYPEDPEDGYMRFASSPKEAPVVWLNGDGPFRFQRWYSDTFSIGGQDDLKVFLGMPGLGENSFCAFQEHVLPAGESVLATLVYEGTDGEIQERDLELSLRC